MIIVIFSIAAENLFFPTDLKKQKQLSHSTPANEFPVATCRSFTAGLNSSFAVYLLQSLKNPIMMKPLFIPAGSYYN
ncbi:MAG: hypothetical protein HQ517_06235 [SAR324 cluster bacterium]|nr:hypothetical protein [SAR324 cluster bacterium]